MRVTLRPFEKQMVEGVLKFANLPMIRFVGEAEECFNGVEIDRPWGGLDPVPGSSLDVYRRDHVAVRDALSAIASGNEPRRREIASLTASMFRDQPIRADFVFKEGRLELVWRRKMALPSWCYFAIALLLERHRGLTNRLGQCRAPGCDRFNLSFTGRPRRYCSDEHADAWRKSTATERMRKSRDRKRRRARRPGELQ